MILTDINLFTKLHFRILEKTSPKTAARKALNLWLTPPQYRPGTEEKLCLQNAEARRVLFKESVYQNSLETYYTLYTWGKGPAVLLVHDWGGSAAQVAPMAQAISDAGFQAIAFDALAHGDSPGQRTDITELIEVILDICNRYNDLHAMCGFSLGALAAVMALQRSARAEKLVVAASAASVDYYLKRFTHTIEVSRQTMGRISTLINTRLKRNIKDFSIINILPTLNISGLILHDKHDDIVSHLEAVALSKLWPMSKLHLTEGLGHQGLLNSRECMGHITDYLKRDDFNTRGVHHRSPASIKE